MVRKSDCRFSSLTSFRYPLKCSLLPAKSYEKAKQPSKTTVRSRWTTVPLAFMHVTLLITYRLPPRVSLVPISTSRCYNHLDASTQVTQRRPDVIQVYTVVWWVSPQVKQGHKSWCCSPFIPVLFISCLCRKWNQHFHTFRTLFTFRTTSNVSRRLVVFNIEPTLRRLCLISAAKPITFEQGLGCHGVRSS